MQIYVVKPGDTLFSIGRALGLAPGFLARYNGLQEPYRLAVGQSLLVLYPEQTVTVQPGDTLTSIAASAGTDVASLYRMNPNLSGSDRIYPGQILVTQLEQAARRPAVVNGYAYPNVSERVLRGILPYAGALVAGISAVWALARMSCGGARLRSYVYEETVAKLPLRCLLTGVFAALLGAAAVGWHREGVWQQQGQLLLCRQHRFHLHQLCVFHPDTGFTALQSPWAVTVQRANLTLVFPGKEKVTVRSVPLAALDFLGI